MNLIQIALASGCIVVISLVGFPGTSHRVLTAMSDQWFDSYGSISWEDEKAHLDNFAIALQQDPNLIGYIIVYAGRRACVGEARDRASRAKRYVVETRGISETQIKWLDGGYREELIVILQPVPSGAPELTASPTLKPSEVRIIKNCEPMSRDEHLHGEYRPSSGASGTGSMKVDEYDFIPFQEERARLDEFATTLSGWAGASGYIVVYPGRNLTVKQAQVRANRAQSYLRRKKFLRKRVVLTLIGAGRTEPVVQLFITVKNGSPPEVPPPR